jgi:hypothetical protein
MMKLNQRFLKLIGHPNCTTTLVGRSSLDSLDFAYYSLPFRTYSLKLTMQRPVGSVGVEALPGWQFDAVGLTIIVA